MTADEIAELEFLSYWQDAVKLRRYDEDAKIKGLIHEHGGFYALSGALHGCVILHPV